MNVLALDTSTVACTVALTDGNERYSRHEEQPREHTRLLLPMIRGLLDEAGIDAAALDAVVLGNGPGSFIGMRIAASVAQGLCFASGAALVPVSSLAAVAAAALPGAGGRTVLVAQDAHMNEVYLAGFERGADGQPREVWPARLQPAGPLPEQFPDAIAAGAGWDRYPALRAANEGWLAGPAGPLYPDARDLLELGLHAWRQGHTVAPERLEPAYLREQVATPPA